mgnify:CR=1 FL=1
MCRTDTGHAEAVEVTFDPDQVSYAELVEHFWQMHNPTQLNRQGPDVGRQYRSAIFFQSQEQQRVAAKVRSDVDASDKWKQPVVTAIEPARAFWPAESFHQDYLQTNPQGYTCHYLRD